MNESQNNPENDSGQLPQQPDQQVTPPPSPYTNEQQPLGQSVNDATPTPTPYGTQPPTPAAYEPQQQAPYQSDAYQAVPQQAGDPNAAYANQAPVSPYAQPIPPTTGAAPGSSKAMAALICGIMAILFSWTIVIGVVLGIVAIVLASQYVKQFGKESKATGGKVTGILGIVFSILTLVSVILLSVFIFAVIENESSSSSYSFSSSSPSTINTNTNTEDSAEQEAVKSVASAAMDSVKNPAQSELEKLAKQIDDDFFEITELRLSDVGVSADEYAKKIAESTKYKIGNVYVTGGTATAYIDVSSIDILNAELSLYDLAEEAYEEGTLNLDNPGEQDVKMLGTLFKQAIDDGEPNDKYISMTCSQTDGKWVVDPSSFESVVQRCYGTY